MSMQLIEKTIQGNGPGRETRFAYYRFRPDQVSDDTVLPKVYIQAALHADEQPGILVVHHLLKLLKQADEMQKLAAEFVIVPMANPIGMAQIDFRQHQGRYDHASGVNFNRQWPDLFSLIKDDVADVLTEDESENRQQIRQLVKNWIDKIEPITARDWQQYWIIREAYNADYVFDLHCDNEALVHLFAVPQMYPEYQDLSDCIGAVATLTAEDSGGGSFDEVWSSLWVKLKQAFPDKAIPDTVCATTVEYRGGFDVFDHINEDDAKRLFAFFQGRELIQGSAKNYGPSPKPKLLNATEMLRVHQHGLLAYKVELGDTVKKDQVVAELIPLDGEDAFMGRVPIRANTAGQIISRNVHKYVWPGSSIAKIVGTETLETRGQYLLED